MKTYSEYLAAGVPLQLAVGGKVLYVQRSEAGQVLKIEFISGVKSESIERVGKGFKAVPAGGFAAIKITATESGTVDFVVTDGEIDVKFDDAATVIGNDDSQAIPVRLQNGARMAVDIAGGNVELTATNVAINNTDALAIPVRQTPGATFVVEQKVGGEFLTREYQAKVVTDYDPVAVTDTRLQLLAAGSSRRGLRVKNTGANAVAMGGAGLTFANAVILIQPGETWNENEAPGAVWYCLTSANSASTINLQTIA